MEEEEEELEEEGATTISYLISLMRSIERESLTVNSVPRLHSNLLLRAQEKKALRSSEYISHTCGSTQPKRSKHTYTYGRIHRFILIHAYANNCEA